MQALTKIKEVLSQRSSQYIPSTMEFTEIDLDHLVDEMKLKETATERGARNQPPSNAEELDNVETRIIYDIEAEKGRNYSTLLSELRAYDDRIAALSLDNKVFEIKSAAQNAISEFGAEVRDGVNQLTMDLRHVQEIHRERLAFRKEHCLNRTASHPDSLLFNWGIIAVLFLIESVLNANFLAVGHEGGLLGGFIEAVGIAFINVGIGVAVGIWAYARVNHRRTPWKVLGWMVILTHLLFAVFFNLFVAHYRLALGGENPELAPTAAVQSFIAGAFHISDFHSWMMVGIGFLFSIGAAFDGFKMNDKYPGYSKLERRYNDALQSYSDHQADIIDSLRDIKDTASNEMHELKEQLSVRRAEFESILSHRGRLVNAFDHRISYLQNCARHLISVYRDANLGARESTAPRYFNKACIIPHPGKVETPTRFTTDQAMLEKTVGNATSELDAASNEMHVKFSTIQDRFPLLNDLLEEAES